jgi:hypothetical protein
MTLTAEPKRPGVAARRAGYVAGVLVNGAMLYAVNVWPGWQAVPFLTDDVSLVLGLVNASILVNLMANVVYVVGVPRWLKALGDLLTATVGLAALLQVWRVFPFAFSSGQFDWALVARLALGLAIGGSGIAIVVALVSLVKNLWGALS